MDLEPPDNLPTAAWARRLRLRQLQLMQELARRPSLTAVAEVLHLTQPAVSQQLAEIESALGVTLFERGRGLRPTPFGQATLRWAAETMAGARRLDAELQALREGASGRVRLGGCWSPRWSLVPRTVARLAVEDPGLRLVVHEDILQGLLPRLTDGDLDVVVGRIDDRVRNAGMRHATLGDDRTAWRCARPPTHAPAAPDLGGHAGLSLGDATRRDRLAPCGSSRPLPARARRSTPRVESTSLAATQAILRDSDCLGPLSGTAGRIARDDGPLRRLALTLAGDEAPEGVVWRVAKPAPAVVRVVHALRAEGAPSTPMVAERWSIRPAAAQERRVTSPSTGCQEAAHRHLR